jgi:hypothetical protein
MSSRQLTAIALVATAIAVVAGCGESSTSKSLTKTELIAKADPICAHFFVELHAHGTKTASELAAKVQELAANEQIEVRELSKLSAPASLSTDWKTIIAGHRTMATDSVRLAQYAREGKLQTAGALITAGQSAEQQVIAIAARDGFKDCARSS